MKFFVIILFSLFSFYGFSQSYLDFYFKSKDVIGSILIYDENIDSWLFNDERDVKRKTPIGSLFNIPTALIGLDLGVISNNPGDYMAWDGVKRYYFGTSNKNWNCNTNLDDALKFKTDWYFQNVSNLIGHKNYVFFLNHLKITDLSYNRNEKFYWHFGGLESTPEQQVKFFKKLSNSELFFRKEYQQYIYESMLMINNEKYTIHGYETFNVFKGERIDWWVGVLKTKDNTYYFSTRIFEDINKKQSSNFFEMKYLITVEIFRLLGYI